MNIRKPSHWLALALALGLGLFAGSAVAQVPTATGTITTQNLVPTGTATAGSCVAIETSNKGVATVKTTGTYTGALSGQLTNNETSWITLGESSTFKNMATGTQTATIPSGEEGLYQVTSIVGAMGFRVCGLGAMTGGAAVDIHTTGLSGGGGAGGVGAGDASAANQSTMITSLSVMDDWDETDRAKVNIIAGQAGVAAGAGAVGATVVRTTQASDSPLVAVNGTTTDAAAASGGTGTHAAKLREISAALANVLTEVSKIDDANTQLPAALGPQTPATSLATFNASATGAVSSVADTATDTTCLAADAATKGASVYNTSSAALYLLLANATSSATNFTVRLLQHDYYEVPYSYTGVIKCIWASDPGDGAALVTKITN